MTVTDGTPSLGQEVTVTFDLTNNFADPIVLGSVGLVGRPYEAGSSINRDFGWDYGVTLAGGKTKKFTYKSTIRDIGKLYVWPSFNYLGSYYGYFIGWTEIQTHNPNITVTNIQPSPGTVFAGQRVNFTMTVRNNEPADISYDALGIPVRFYDRWNYDAGWDLQGTITASSTKNVTGSVVFDKPGPYTVWGSVSQSGQYRNLFSPSGVQYYSYRARTVYPDFKFGDFWVSSIQPTVGEEIVATYSLKNNLPAPITIDAVGFVARPFNIFSSTNRDFGWYPNVTFQPGEKKVFTFKTNLKDAGKTYVWPSFNYQGYYYNYYMGWTELNSR
jgi:hypothetical protein